MPAALKTAVTALFLPSLLPGGAASAAATKNNEEEKKKEKKTPADRRGNMAGGGKKNVITISLSKNHYLAGDVATGTVNLEAKAEEDDKSQENHVITLTLIGRAKTRTVVNMRAPLVLDEGGGGEATSHVDEDHKDIINYNIQLATLQRKVVSGIQSFPFSVVLPPGLPPSMQEHSPDGSACAIVYGFEARLHCPWDASAAYFDASSSTRFSMLASPDEEETPPAPVNVGPETKAIKTCFSSGSMSVGFEADCSTAGHDKPVSVAVAVSNDSSCKVKGLQIRIRQHSDWYADGGQGSATRTIASLDVPASQLDGTLSVSKKGNTRTAAAGDTARIELRDIILAGKGTRYQISVTEKCHPTMQTGIIEVRHSLCVRVRAKGWNVAGPEVSMPLRVLQNRRRIGGVEAGARGGGPGGGSGKGGADEIAATAHAAVLREAAHRGLRPVSVPHSAVTIDYSTDIIGPPVNVKVYS